ncbi:cytochrome P450 [Micromonospora sp. DT4]|uniref:cytochrome P450 n=1 Tax=Micromonospora sp. DT4 TaxID=3393438 RepID=UPI003CF0E688
MSAVYSPHGVGTTWFVTSYALARAALADHRLSNDGRNGGEWLNPEVADDAYRARGLLNLDRPEHARLRKLVNGAFSAQAVTRWTAMMERVCHAAVDRLIGETDIDLVSGFALPVPVAIIHEVLGIPEDQRKDPARCFELFYRAGLAHGAGPELYEELFGYVDHLISYKRAHRGDDVMSLLITHTEKGDLAGDRELRSMVLGILGAGHVTTVQFFGCAILRLLTHPEQRARLEAGEVGWAQGVNEMMRIDSPIQATVYRYATEDLELGEVQVRRGDAVLISIAAANRDPARFADPDDFVVGRQDGSNLAFGHGVHLCLGVHLARIEAELGLQILFRRLGKIDLAIPTSEIVWAYGPMLRGPRRLPASVSSTGRR